MNMPDASVRVELKTVRNSMSVQEVIPLAIS